MKAILNKNLFFIKEHVGLGKAANNFDILDPESGEVIMICREENLGFFTKLFRFSDFKRMTPFDIRVKTAQGDPIVRVTRDTPVVVSWVRVFDEDDNLIGGFKLRPFSISGTFDVLDANDRLVCLLKGGLTGWTFRFRTSDNVELAHVTKKWAGLGKELFTGADDYMLKIDEVVPPDSTTRQLILASVVCIGMVLKVEMP